MSHLKLRLAVTMSGVIRSLRLAVYSSASVLLAIVLVCGLQFLRTRFAIAKLPFAEIVEMCSGQTTIVSTCECYNYYGRHCLSAKRLVWDWVPGDADPEAEHATPLKLKDLIEEELYLTEENV